MSAQPNTSAAKFNVDELKNFIVGLSKINDISVFYGRDEKPGTAFRDPNYIEELLSTAEQDKLNVPAEAICRFFLEDGHLIMESYLEHTPNVRIEGNDLILTFITDDKSEIMKEFYFDILEDGMLIIEDPKNIIYRKDDPNGGLINSYNPNYPVQDYTVFYTVEDGMYVLPSGESDGEEITTDHGLGPDNFYDDYGARPGDSNFHPYNRHISNRNARHWIDQDDQRNVRIVINYEGGVRSSTFGQNPRNPNPGNPYKSRPAYRGTDSTCHSQCTGLCLQSCDNICSESCTTTCTFRCGNSCTSSCGNSCTGCSSLCLSSCKTQCENTSGYACVNAGAKAVKITTSGGTDGIPARNEITYETHACEGCSYSCQFYPNKKTDCWDAGCMSKCFTTCSNACSTSCFGGCIDNENRNQGDYRTGIGRGCSSHCTINCIGNCQGICEGACTSTCWHACKDTCADNCSYDCNTACGNGCANGCAQACTGCSNNCDMGCKGMANSTYCAGCSTRGGCTSQCQNDCASNCLGQGCRAICGIESTGACEANCRIGCMNASCTAICSDACSSACTNCVGSCNMNCGACTSNCSTGCGADCNIICTATCEHSCEISCLRSCQEGCSGCSNLCYSCVGMCIGICSVTCMSGCSSCTKTCGWWCDKSCNQRCFSNCDNMCMTTCVGCCITRASSETTTAHGPARPPISPGYPTPTNRLEEQQSFKVTGEDV